MIHYGRIWDQKQQVLCNKVQQPLNFNISFKSCTSIPMDATYSTGQPCLSTTL